MFESDSGARGQKNKGKKNKSCPARGWMAQLGVGQPPLRGTRGVAELKQLVVLVIFLTTFSSALIPLVEPRDSPASIAP